MIVVLNAHRRSTDLLINGHDTIGVVNEVGVREGNYGSVISLWYLLD